LFRRLLTRPVFGIMVGMYLILYLAVYVFVFGYLGFWVAVECGLGR